MKRINIAAAIAALAVSTLPITTPFAAPQRAGVELGMLDCAIGSGTGFIIGSQKPVSCTFRPTNRKFAPETYTGSVNKWGVDIGHTRGGVMRWLVLGPSLNIYKPRSLAGGYVGASAEATAGIGGGANVLVGGSGNTFHLQPVSVQGQTGLNVALGVTNFQLHAAR